MYYLETANYNWMELLNFCSVPFRAKFIPAKVWRDLDNYQNDSVGLGNYIKKWRTKIEWHKEKSNARWAKSHVRIGGEYAPEVRQITLQIHTDTFNSFIFTDASWKDFKMRFFQTIMHELIHFMQFDRRGDEWSNYVVPYKKIGITKKDEQRAYLSEFDEIQAYAHCVYLDYKMRRPNVDINILLKRYKNKRDSPTLHFFLKTFNYDLRNNMATRKIIDQIGKWDRKYNRIT